MVCVLARLQAQKKTLEKTTPAELRRLIDDAVDDFKFAAMIRVSEALRTDEEAAP